MEAFRGLSDYFISSGETLCSDLMLGLTPTIDLSVLKDDLTNCNVGYSFVEHLSNGLKNSYLHLVREACSKQELLRRDKLNLTAVSSYRRKVTALKEVIPGGFHIACGQSPRAEDILAMECENGPAQCVR